MNYIMTGQKDSKRKQIILNNEELKYFYIKKPIWGFLLCVLFIIVDYNSCIKIIPIPLTILYSIINKKTNSVTDDKNVLITYLSKIK
jgi:hypothetical protein